MKCWADRMAVTYAVCILMSISTFFPHTRFCHMVANVNKCSHSRYNTWRKRVIKQSIYVADQFVNIYLLLRYYFVIRNSEHIYKKANIMGRPMKAEVCMLHTWCLAKVFVACVNFFFLNVTALHPIRKTRYGLMVISTNYSMSLLVD